MRSRLQRLLAAAGLASRREAEEWIRAGRVAVNGVVAKLGDSADPERDAIRVDGRPLAAEPHAYWLLHKPRGVLSTRRDPHAGGGDRRTVLELLPAEAARVRLVPVGRLDRDSEGLLLLTNDGATVQALLHPSLGTEKEYRVWARGRVSAATARALAAGPVLDDGRMAPSRVTQLAWDAARDETRLTLTLQEGRKRLIRRALASLGHPVRRLLRVRMGPLVLGTLRPGEARPLRADERRKLAAHVARCNAKAASRASAGAPSGNPP